MLQQQLTDLDFDTYFDVSTIQSAQQQQQTQQMFDQSTQQAIHSNQQSNNIAHFPQQQFFMPQQQQQHQPPQTQAFEAFDWCFKQQQQQQQQQNHRQQRTASSTPATTPGNTSPNHHNGPDYFYSAQQQSNPAMHVPLDMPSRFDFNLHRPSAIVKEEQLNYGFDNNSSLMCSLRNESSTTITVSNSTPVNMINKNNSGISTPMSEMTFPETPQSRHSSSESNSPSPVSASVNVTPFVAISPPLVNAFAAIDQWGKNIDKGRSTLTHDFIIIFFSLTNHSNVTVAISGCTDKIKEEDNHEVRHWRRTIRSDSVASNTSNMVAAAVAAVAARSTPRSPVETGRQLKKVAHNAIERRYRNNINDRIRDLKNVVPALYKAKIREKRNPNSKSGFEDEDSSDEESNNPSNTVSSGGDEDNDGEIVDGVEVAKKLNKATILHKATEYIHHLKHTNELTRRENQVLQQILAQMPGGAKVLARFQMQKSDFEQAEQQRILTERRELMERERAERQRMLRERAAQRAALAELLPKPERRPYRRRAKKQQHQEETQQKQQNDNKIDDCNNASSPTDKYINEEQQTNTTIESDGSLSDTADTPNNKMLMAMFLCLTLVSPLAFENTTENTQYHRARVLSSQKPQQIELTLTNSAPFTLDLR